MSDFKAALPKPITWATRQNTYDTTGKKPRSLSLFIPRESAVAFAQYLITMADDNEKVKTGTVYDYDAKQKVKVEGFYINAKGMQGDDGDYGDINPAAPQWQAPAQPAAKATSNDNFPF